MKILNQKRILLVAVILGVTLVSSHCSRRPQFETEMIKRGELAVWSLYIGTIEPQNVRNVVSHIRGSATLTEIVPDGTLVTQGMTVACFDASNWEDEMVEAEKNLLLARADYDSLVHAKLPIELSDLESSLMKARQALNDEQQTLSDTRDLLAEDLVPEYEVKQLEQRVEALGAEIAGLIQTLNLTKRYLHPAARQRAQASLDSASNAHATISKKIEMSVVKAPSNGIVVHKQTNIGNEYRTVRTGDTIWHTQVFIMITDMSDLIARCSVPEPELTRIVSGAHTVVHPVAYPAMKLTGTVASVSSMARHLPGRSDGARFFDVIINLNETDTLLRSDMSAVINILSYKSDDALLIPRSAVWWEQGRSFCNVMKFGQPRKTPVSVGMADNSHFELLNGVQPEQKVVVR